MRDRDDIGQCSRCGADVSIGGRSEEYHAGLTVLCDDCHDAWEAATLDDEGRYLPLPREGA